MRLVWSSRALSDLARLHDFLLPRNPRAATDVLRSIHAKAAQLREMPRRGERINIPQVEVRRIFIGNYELRYQLAADSIFILRVWHVREDR